ncbi:MAG: hypothetical protein HYR96_15900 [Deltaproteobacteria bacterium]|nr:hypothetical protein [Deltaproteobacteria bacterium]MBI3294452.1 hypothetical protein [Deltaproteobacteria bacterium]
MKNVLFLALVSLSSWAAVYSTGPIRLQYDDSHWRIGAAHNDKGNAQSEVLVGLEEKESFERYHSRFTVVAEDVSKFHTETPAGLKKYYRSVGEFLTNQRFQITNRKDTQLGGRAAYEITANQRDFGLGYRQWVVVEGNKAYLMTASTRLSKFDEKAPALTAMAESFNLK